jgi:CDK-activating kinase assembly factor MAT1
VYNKTEKDFASLVEYNNYLEEVEDMIYAIVNEEPAAEEIKASIKEYEQRYKSDIDKRQSKRDDEKRNIQDRIDAEHRQTEKNRKLAVEEEKNIAINKRKFKTETTEVLLGEREEVTAELIQAQMQGYRNELRRQQQGRQNQAVNFVSPRVREPATGLAKRETHVDRQLYSKRQRAGGGIPVGSIASQDRTWNETVQTLFARL